MRKLEIAFFISSVAALVAKFVHVPGSGIWFTLSMLALASLYFGGSIAIMPNISLARAAEILQDPRRNKPLLLAAIAGFSLAAVSIGVLFSFQVWPGAKINLIIGLLVSIAMAAIVRFQHRRIPDTIYVSAFKRLVVGVLISVSMLYIPLKFWLNIQYPHNPEYVEALLQANEQPYNKELWEKVHTEQQKMQAER